MNPEPSATGPAVTLRQRFWERARGLFILKSAQPVRVLTPLQIFWRFAQDTLLTAAIYVLLVLATLVLRYFAELMNDATLHHWVLDKLEHAIFFCGSAIVFLVLIYVTTITTIDLFHSFRRSMIPLPLPQSASQSSEVN